MRTLFVDFDGTLCHDRFWRSLPEAEYCLIEQALFKDNRPMVDEWMRGEFDSEDINAFVSQETGLPFAYLWDAFVEDCRTMHVPNELLARIASLRKRFHTVLITGNMDCFDRFTLPVLTLSNYFDTIVNSYNEKQLKDDDAGASFLKHVSGDIHEAILIDDSPRTCATFEALGGTAYRVTPETSTQAHLITIEASLGSVTLL